MRRSRRRTVNDGAKSSSDDSDHQSTMDIIEKMSKKFLGPEKPTPRPLRGNKGPEKPTPQPLRGNKKTSSNASSTPLPRVTRIRSKSRHDVAYEGDVDTSAGTSQSDVDLYDFDEANEENLCLVLFPSKLASTKKRTLRPKPNAPKQTSKLPPQPKQTGCRQKTAVLKSSNKNAKQAKCTEKQPQPKSNTGNKRKSSPSQPGPMLKKSHIEQTATRTEQTATRMEQTATRTEQTATRTEQTATRTEQTAARTLDVSMFDSGVFMSPIEHVPEIDLMTPDLTPIPTPNLSDMSMEHRVPAIGYDSLLETPLELSPVKTSRGQHASPARQPILQPMDLGSPQLKSPIVEKTYGHRGLFTTPLEKIEKKKKMRAKPRVTTKRVDAWALKINAEFEELEMYDLSID